MNRMANFLYFGTEIKSKDRVWFWTRDGELHIDGGGVDVKVVEANIGATNGVIHSVNKVRIKRKCSVISNTNFEIMQS